jgi:hypothetical protein
MKSITLATTYRSPGSIVISQEVELRLAVGFEFLSPSLGHEDIVDGDDIDGLFGVESQPNRSKQSQYLRKCIPTLTPLDRNWSSSLT